MTNSESTIVKNPGILRTRSEQGNPLVLGGLIQDISQLPRPFAQELCQRTHTGSRESRFRLSPLNEHEAVADGEDPKPEHRSLAVAGRLADGSGIPQVQGTDYGGSMFGSPSKQ